MQAKRITFVVTLLYLATVLFPLNANARLQSPGVPTAPVDHGFPVLLVLLLSALLSAVVFLSVKVRLMIAKYRKGTSDHNSKRFTAYLESLDSGQIERILLQLSGNRMVKKPAGSGNIAAILSATMFLLAALFPGNTALAQEPVTQQGLLSEEGVIITITLLLIPILAAIVLMIVKISGLIRKQR